MNSLLRIVTICLVQVIAFTSCMQLCHAQSSTRDKLVVESLLRLKDVDIKGNEKLEGAVQRYLKAVRGTPKFFEVITKLQYGGATEQLLEVALQQPLDSNAVQAANILLDFGHGELLTKNLSSDNSAIANASISVLAQTSSKHTLELLKPIVIDPNMSRQIKSAAVSGVGNNLDGQRYLLELLKQETLAKELHFVAGNALFSSPDKTIREDASKYIMLPKTAGNANLPPLSSLISRQGDAEKGHTLFRNKATCAKCHKVNNEGKEVGPDLSEIGSKLSKSAMYVSILDPSAGISHNYETYSIVTVNGNILTGVLVSKSDSKVIIKTAEAVSVDLPVEEIDEMFKTGVSLMPADLQKVLSVDELVNVVEYLQTLKKQ